MLQTNIGITLVTLQHDNIMYLFLVYNIIYWFLSYIITLWSLLFIVINTHDIYQEQTIMYKIIYNISDKEGGW